MLRGTFFDFYHTFMYVFFRIYFRCGISSCDCRWNGHLPSCPSNAPVAMIFTRFGEPNHVGLPTRKWSSKTGRQMVQDELDAGKGPTEAWENTALKLGASAPTLSSVRKSRQPGSKTISTQDQLMVLLQRTLNGTVNENSPVPGYIQVRLFIHFVLS